MEEISFYGSHDMRKDAFFFLLIMLTTVADEDLAAAVLDKEIDLNCTLKPWDVTLLAREEHFCQYILIFSFLSHSIERNFVGWKVQEVLSYHIISSL